MTATPWWHDLGACKGADADLFFSDHEPTNQQTINTFCAGCPVVAECLDDELGRGGGKTQQGVRGGMTAHARRRLIRARAKQAARC